MDKINIVTVVFKDKTELVMCATTTPEKALKAHTEILKVIEELSEERVTDLTSTNGDEFDEDYEDYLFSKELAENFSLVKITQVPLNSLYKNKL